MLGATPREGELRTVLGRAPLPVREPRGEGDETLRCSLVRVAHYPLLPRRERRPRRVPLLIAETCHGMGSDRPGQLGVPVVREPPRPGIAVAQRAQRIMRGKQLVYVVEQRR